MAVMFLLVLCASAFFVKTISCQCLGSPYNAGVVGSGIIADGFGLAAGYGPTSSNAMAYDALSLAAGYPGLAYGNVAPASGRGFLVTSSSPIAPTGISVASQNAIEGILAVTGQLPVLAAVALEGALPTTGSGSIMYDCGNGAIGIVSEGIESLAAPAATIGYENALAAELAYGTQLGGGLGNGAPMASGLSYDARVRGRVGSRGNVGEGPVFGP